MLFGSWKSGGGRTQVSEHPAQASMTEGSTQSGLGASRPFNRPIPFQPERTTDRPRSTDRATGWRDQDVVLGCGMVAAFCVIVLGTDVLFHIGSGSRSAIAAVAGTTAAVDLGLLGMFRRPRRRPTLLWFPVLLVASEVALSLLPGGGGAIGYTGFFTLMFVFIGLTQRRGTGPLFALVAAPAWVFVERPWTAEVGVKLLLSLTIWLLISEVLAARTERVRIRTKRLLAQANIDVLTGLWSRLYLSDHIERLVMDPDAPSPALLLIDLDGFKVINDTHGHSAGDELLVAVARRIQATLREGDLAARLGGDEFVALVEGSTMDQAAELARRMLSALSVPYALSRGRVTITASIGIVEIVPPTTAELALRDADRAIHEAKSTGRNRVAIYEGSMHERTVTRLALETELRDALADNQFEAHYQPVVHTGTGAIIGAEALIRWRHPQRGLQTPDSFLAISEEIGLMEPLGDWILRAACRQARAWQSIDPARAFTVAVNLSAPEMFSADLIDRVGNALQESGLPGTLLVLEITERIMMADCQQATRQLEQLRRLGVRIAIDDFGTGYSSLAYLRELPIDIVKIDKSFVKPLGSDHQALALLRAIVGMANALDLDVIVEGAETAAQIELLDGLGCQIVQGFYFGRPTSAKELTKRLTWPTTRWAATEPPMT